MEQEKQYNKIIDMLCLTGKMPVELIDEVCDYAKASIYKAISTSKETRIAERERLLFGETNTFMRDYKSAWLDYEMENMSNFSMS